MEFTWRAWIIIWSGTLALCGWILPARMERRAPPDTPPPIRILFPYSFFHPELRQEINREGLSACIRLRSGRAELVPAAEKTVCNSFPDQKPLWTSPADWDVSEARWTDLNRDGLAEMTLLVWRPYRPWYVDRYLPHSGRTAAFHDREGRSCQLIMIGWKRNALREIWAGSALAEPLVVFYPLDLDEDQAEELLTLETDYADRKQSPVRSAAIWEWNGFGFSLLARANPAGLSILKNPSKDRSSGIGGIE